MGDKRQTSIPSALTAADLQDTLSRYGITSTPGAPNAIEEAGLRAHFGHLERLACTVSSATCCRVSFGPPCTVAELGLAGLTEVGSVTIRTPRGQPIGQLRVFGAEPVTFDERQREGLRVIAEQVMVQLELERKVHELATLNEELDRFTAVAAHDLRSPLRAMGSFAGLLRRRMRERMSEEESEMFDHIRAGAARLSVMVEGLLNFAKARNQNYTEVENIDIPTLVGEVADLVDPDQRFKIVFEGEGKRVRANRTALQHILLNLVSNAVKYHDKPHGQVIVACFAERGDSVLLSVTDDGPGIAADDQARIFDAFETGDHDLHVPSTGLGLALVRRLVDRLGGFVHLESTLGQGSRFEVRLPL